MAYWNGLAEVVAKRPKESWAAEDVTVRLWSDILTISYCFEVETTDEASVITEELRFEQVLAHRVTAPLLCNEILRHKHTDVEDLMGNIWRVVDSEWLSVVSVKSQQMSNILPVLHHYSLYFDFCGHIEVLAGVFVPNSGCTSA